MIIKTGILGVSGYTGQSLLRLLIKHPVFKLTSLYSTSFEGKYSDRVPEFSNLELPPVTFFDVSKCEELDVIFLAVPHTRSMGIVSNLMAEHKHLKIIDLSADFRLKNKMDYEDRYGVSHVAPQLLDGAVYGLPEKYSNALASTRLCASPGCYATSMILGLLPLVGRLDSNAPIIIDSKSGVSGAGKALKESSLFCEIHDHLSAYSTGDHRHMSELVQESGFSNVLFSPHLVPMYRGIESAIYIHGRTLDNVYSLYEQYYDDHPFVTVYPSDTQPTTRLVTNTNDCAIIPKKIGDWVVVFSLLDNLIKGASGQAIQSANIMAGLDQTTGLN